MTNFLDLANVDQSLIDAVNQEYHGIDSDHLPYRSYRSPLVVCNGEMDFHPGRRPGEIYRSLLDRCEQVGAIVQHRPAAGSIIVLPWGGGRYALHYDPNLGAEHPDARITAVTVTNRETDASATLTMRQIIAHGIARDRLFAALDPEE